ncbi:unnamed protein product [Paramecium sonneborni]|uniref:Uncharacterized protein n=1 Tax=Paramecium sonneborni TaxID=65129 RepID=A0A8S1LZ39_9CILI|nr:unnamed protein product [Paramecium sonneborni]
MVLKGWMFNLRIILDDNTNLEGSGLFKIKFGRFYQQRLFVTQLKKVEECNQIQISNLRNNNLNQSLLIFKTAQIFLKNCLNLELNMKNKK